ncbi:hypothetical protein [Flyfo microvirus Tbat2_110]|nr:hypothetical protein [Flyfo microvirus Tbat2_110]
MQREWQLEDRDEERAYNRAELNESRTYAEEQSRKVFSQLVEDAQTAGFNPLTLVRSGGAASYGGSAGFAPLSATPLTRQAPVRQAVGGSPFGDAVGSAATSFLNNFDPFADQRRGQEYRLVESQIAALNASALSRVPRGAGSYASGDIERRPSSKGGMLGKPAMPTAGEVEVTNPWQSMETDPDVRDAAAFEQRYGEPGSWLGGVYVIARDWGHNVERVTAPAVNWVRNNYTKPAAKSVQGIFGQVRPAGSAPLSKPPKDTFSEPFPPWAW